MRKRTPRKRGYRYSVRLVREYLRPVEPPPRLVVEIRDLRRLFGDDLRALEEGHLRRRRGRKVALAFTLPFFGMVSYLLARHLLRRQEGEAGERMAATA